jgi:hypothetical protein
MRGFMTQKHGAILIVVAVVFVACCGLGFYDVPSGFARLYFLVALACFIFLAYFRRKWSAGSPK